MVKLTKILISNMLLCYYFKEKYPKKFHSVSFTVDETAKPLSTEHCAKKKKKKFIFILTLMQSL